MIALLTVTCWPLIGSAVTNTSSSSSSSSWPTVCWCLLSVFKLLVLTTLALSVLVEPPCIGNLVAWTPCHCHHWEMLSPWKWHIMHCKIWWSNPLCYRDKYRQTRVSLIKLFHKKTCSTISQKYVFFGLVFFLTWLLLRFLRSEFHCCSLSLKWRNLEASVFSVAFGSPIAMPSSSSLARWSSCSWKWLRSSLFDLDNESPEEKLEQRFLIFLHLRANVPLPLANKGVGAILKKKKETH